MRSSFGHIGDAFEGIREIYDRLRPGSDESNMLVELAVKLAELEADTENLRYYMGDTLDKNTPPKAKNELFKLLYTADEGRVMVKALCAYNAEKERESEAEGITERESIELSKEADRADFLQRKIH